MPSAEIALQPRQIVCWDVGDRRLYAEVIQIIPERATCWVRPLALAESAHLRTAADCCDLRAAPDLVWSAAAFRPALDSEAIPVLAAIAGDAEPGSEPIARQQLNQFLRQAWQARAHSGSA